MTATEISSVQPDDAVRDVVTAATEAHGLKKGLHIAARLLGVTDRWVRAVRYGEPARISAETYLRALHARRVLRAERRARLLAELQAIEAEADADDLDAPLAGADLGERRALGVGRGLRQAGAEAA